MPSALATESSACRFDAVSQYRKEIAGLRRQVRAQEKEIAFLKSLEQKRQGERLTAEEPVEKVRFSARSVKAQRTRLRLSAEQYGRLVGVSSLTIYSWEQGKSRPRKTQLAHLVAVRGIGKRAALARLDALNGKKA